ncbi:MAG: hypothetical protein LBM99_00465, partial [Bacillales bacterium]|nr:hypothetical protein [Bacillales bacterium]
KCYIKRTNLKSYQNTASRSAEGAYPKRKDDDVYVGYGLANTDDHALLFFKSGYFAYLSINDFPDLKWGEEGSILKKILPSCNDGEQIVSMFIIKSIPAFANVVLLSNTNKITRFKLTSFIEGGNSKKVLKAMNLDSKHGEFLLSAQLTDGDSQVFIVSSKGKATKYHENEIPNTQLGIKGVKALQDSNSLPGGFVSIYKDSRVFFAVFAHKGGYNLYHTNQIESRNRNKGGLENLFKTYQSKPQTVVRIFPADSIIDKEANEFKPDLYISNRDVKVTTFDLKKPINESIERVLMDNIGLKGNETVVDASNYELVYVDNKMKTYEPLFIPPIIGLEDADLLPEPEEIKVIKEVKKPLKKPLTIKKEEKKEEEKVSPELFLFDDF